MLVLLTVAAAALSACGGSAAPEGPPPSAATAVSASSGTSSLSSLIEAENAAIYAYGVIGAHLSGAERRKALAALKDHRRLRDAWIVAATAAEIPVPPAAIAYDLPIVVRDAATAETLWIEIETRLVATYESAGETAVKALAESRSRLTDLSLAP
jgi:H+/gluconate symporter-like permease